MGILIYYGLFLERRLGTAKATKYRMHYTLPNRKFYDKLFYSLFVFSFVIFLQNIPIFLLNYSNRLASRWRKALWCLGILFFRLFRRVSSTRKFSIFSITIAKCILFTHSQKIYLILELFSILFSILHNTNPTDFINFIKWTNTDFREIVLVLWKWDEWTADIWKFVVCW